MVDIPRSINRPPIVRFETSAEARAEVLRRDPALEHAISTSPFKRFSPFYVVSGTAHSVAILPGSKMYMHTHPGEKSYALPSSIDMCIFAKQAKKSLSYETMIYSTSPTHPGMCHLRWLDGQRFHLIYADGALPSASPTAPQFFGPTREFEVTVDHDAKCVHHELVITTRATATPLTYRFTERDAMSALLGEQWLWGQILAGVSPDEVGVEVKQCAALNTVLGPLMRTTPLLPPPFRRTPLSTLWPSTPPPASIPSPISPTPMNAPTDEFISAAIAAGLPPPKPSCLKIKIPNPLAELVEAAGEFAL